MCFDLKAVAAALCPVLFLSCSVKEDRDVCPCFLTLDLDGVDAAGLVRKGIDSLVIAVGSGEDFYLEEGFGLRELANEAVYPVPRSRVEVMAACGPGSGDITDGGVSIPEGSECPVFYLYSESFSTEAGDMSRTVILHKEYCTLTASMKSSLGSQPRPYRIRLEGNVSGCSMDGTPAEGPFDCLSSPSAGGLCRLNIPRQRDGSLRLEVYFLDSDEVRSFPVGEYILDSGYDWSARDLEDIEVEMDFARSSLTVSTSKWKKTLSFEITF